MAAPLKLTDADVKQIHRRVRAGEKQTDLAGEFGVDRKTIRRRLDALELAEAERAERIAKNRIRRQATREKRKLLDRERGWLPPPTEHRTPKRRAGLVAGVPDYYLEWLDRRKNLSGRALAEARGLVRVRNSDGTRRVWVERADVGALLDDGWLLDD